MPITRSLLNKVDNPKHRPAFDEAAASLTRERERKKEKRNRKHYGSTQKLRRCVLQLCSYFDLPLSSKSFASLIFAAR